jgi:GNAT superfamily N-acetyltransferase/predicted transcriptional regulator
MQDDIIRNLAELALASRMRRIADGITADVAEFMGTLHIEFEPRWFPLFYLLTLYPTMAIVDAAKHLGISHPAVNQIAAELLKAELIIQAKDDEDKRKRLLSLSEKGHTLLTSLQPVWQDIRLAAAEMITDTGFNLLYAFDRMEQVMSERRFYDRIAQQHKARLFSEVSVERYQAHFAEAFKRLNTAWISRYFEVEPEDEKILSHPQREILDAGGEILFARYQGTLVGTCALQKISDSTFELAKMAVDETIQGKGFGKALLIHAIQWAKNAGAQTLILDSNTQLQAAICLYRKCGFMEVPQGSHFTPFARTNIQMQLDLNALPSWLLSSLANISNDFAQQREGEALHAR